MPHRVVHHISESATDYTLAGVLTGGGGFLLFVEQSTPILGWLGLFIGVLVGLQRLCLNHRNRDK